jgi:hypothetical protein
VGGESVEAMQLIVERNLAPLRYTRAITDIAAAIPCHGGTSIEGPIGTVASLHLACVMTYDSELFGPPLMREELLTQPLRYAEGALHLPDGPGSGWSSIRPPSPDSGGTEDAVSRPHGRRRTPRSRPRRAHPAGDH